MDFVSEHYETLESLLNRVETANPISRTVSSVSNDVRWAGVVTSDAIKLARQGWLEGRQFMSSLLTVGKAQTAAMSVKGQSLDVGGAYPFIPAACAGDPMNMWNITEEANKTKPVIRLYVPSVFPANYSHDDINNLGGACLTLVDQLENSGVQIEITIYYATNMERKYESKSKPSLGILSCNVKNAGEPVDIDRLAFALCNPAMCRRLWFRIMECSPEFNHLCPTGYGFVKNASKEMVEQNSIVLPAPTSERFGMDIYALRTPALACAWVMTQFKNSEFADMLTFE